MIAARERGEKVLPVAATAEMGCQPANNTHTHTHIRRQCESICFNFELSALREKRWKEGWGEGEERRAGQHWISSISRVNEYR